MSFHIFPISTFFISILELKKIAKYITCIYVWREWKKHTPEPIYVGFDLDSHRRGVLHTFVFRFNFAFGNFNFREKCDLHVCRFPYEPNLVSFSSNDVDANKRTAKQWKTLIKSWGWEWNMCVMANQTNDAMKCAQIYSCIYYDLTATMPTCLLSSLKKKVREKKR